MQYWRNAAAVEIMRSGWNFLCFEFKVPREDSHKAHRCSAIVSTSFNEKIPMKQGRRSLSHN
jgi:hypothetical protein